MPLLELPISLREWATDIAFDVAFLTCSFSVRCELIHMPKYLMVFNGVMVQDSPLAFVGMVMEGGPECLPLLDLVK